MDLSLSRGLHTLVSTLDRAADRILRDDHRIGYSQFLLLYAVREVGAGTQREVALWLGGTEGAVSRSLRALATQGLVQIRASAMPGHRKEVTLTPTGADLVELAGADLESRLAAVVADADVDYAVYSEQTSRLLASVTRAGVRAT